VELRPKKDNPEEQRQNADMPSLGLHVLTKTKLRLEWLQGQAKQFGSGATRLQPTCTLNRPKC